MQSPLILGVGRCGMRGLLLLWLLAGAAQASPSQWTVGVDPDFYPFSYLDADGNPVGFSIDLIQALAARQQVSLRFRVERWSRLRELLQRGEIDVIPSMVVTPERATQVNFSVPFVRGELRLLQAAGRQRSSRSAGLEQLLRYPGQRIAVLRGSIAHDYLAARVAEQQLLAVHDREQLLNALDAGEAGAALVFMMEGMAAWPEGAGAVLATEPLQAAGQWRWMALAAPKDRPEMVQQLNEGLGALIASGAYERLHTQWLARFQPRQVLLSRALWVLGGVLLLGFVCTALTLAWSWALRREVRHRSEQLQREHARRARLEQQLLQAQQLESLGALAHSVAHDFKNILSGLVGYIGLAQERLAQQRPEKVAAYLEQMAGISQRADELVRQLLLFKRRGEGSPDLVDPAALLQEVAGLLAPGLPTAVRLQVEPPSAPCRVRVDAGNLHQMLLNLGVNARDALGGAGELHLACETLQLERSTCSACGEPLTGRWVALSVMDNGAGIDADRQHSIFQLGYTTKAEGTGTGLATVARLVHAHQGHIRVESRVGQGSRFCLLFPEPDRLAAVPDAAGASAGYVPVLLVEPDQVVAEYLSAYLQVQGLRVTTIGSLDSPQPKGTLSGPPPAAVVLSGALNDPAVPQCLARARQLWPGSALLLCSGVEQDRQRARWEPLGLAGVVARPIDPQALYEALRDLLYTPAGARRAAYPGGVATPADKNQRCVETDGL